MKVFLSWSGKSSHSIACIFREWLPQLLNKAEPYVSSEDIDLGERWSTDIAKELEASSFGIVFVTRENLLAPWIHFEAGALSKSIERVNAVPLLFDVRRSEVNGPLLQFQSALCEPADIEKLVMSINRRLPEEDRRSEPQLKTGFEVWWPRLKASLEGVKAPTGAQAVADTPAVPSILEEILEMSRSQQKLLRETRNLLSEMSLARPGEVRVEASPGKVAMVAEVESLRHDLIRLRAVARTDDEEVHRLLERDFSLLQTIESALLRRDEYSEAVSFQQMAGQLERVRRRRDKVQKLIEVRRPDVNAAYDEVGPDLPTWGERSAGP